MYTKNFGIEIELTGITREVASNLVAAYFKTNAEPIKEYRYAIQDNKNRTWFITRDRSIRPEINQKNVSAPEEDTSNYLVELITPVLTLDELWILNDIVELFKINGGIINETCGIHIHLDLEPHTPQTLQKLITVIHDNSKLLYEALDIPINRLKYCRKFSKTHIENLNKQDFTSLEHMSDIWYSIYPNDERDTKYNKTRYYGLNLHSAFHKNTIEFRYFNSCLDIDRIKAYLDFCFSLNTHSLNANTKQIRANSFSELLSSIGIGEQEYYTLTQEKKASSL